MYISKIAMLLTPIVCITYSYMQSKKQISLKRINKYNIYFIISLVLWVASAIVTFFIDPFIRIL